MSGNSFGKAFNITSFGESHGGAVGVVIDGVPPRMAIDIEYIQRELDRRKPGQSDVTSPRKEPDRIHILSGVFEGLSTGTPILLILYNKDANPSAYEEIKDKFRPGHADFSYLKKYGIRDFRGSGRASGRETAARVAAGAIAKLILQKRGVSIQAYTLQIGDIRCRDFDPEVIEKNPLRACDLSAAEKMLVLVQKLKEEENSVGGIIECKVNGVEAGIGDPVFDKLDAELAHAILSIGAVKGIEFGTGFAGTAMTGKEHNDEMSRDGFLSNNAGGIIGGISTGEEILFRLVVKPTSSIAQPQKTINTGGEEVEIRTEGRHDACICPRIIPVVEAMTAIVLEDLYKRQAALGI